MQPSGDVIVVLVILWGLVVGDMIDSQGLAEQLHVPRKTMGKCLSIGETFLSETLESSSELFRYLDPVEIIHRQHCRSLVLVADKAESLLLSSLLVSNQIDVDNLAVL